MLKLRVFLEENSNLDNYYLIVTKLNSWKILRGS